MEVYVEVGHGHLWWSNTNLRATKEKWLIKGATCALVQAMAHIRTR